MNNTRRFKRLAACSLAIALTGPAQSVLADGQTKPPCQDNPGMMGGYGMNPGMMGGYGMGPGMMGGYGMNPGMMGGYGMGPGMMGGYGMGPGMMGGYGMNPGMMGGYGMGPGMMDGYWGSWLDLTEEQLATINKIHEETRKAHWALMYEMLNQQARLRELYQAPTRDNAAIDAATKEFGKLQQQMYDSAVDAHKRMEGVLTKEQQERLQKLRTYWQRRWAPMAN